MITTIRGELQFGLNNFGKQTVLSEADSLSQLILNMLFLKPGQIPSLPYIGINIHKYLYRFEDNLDVEELKDRIKEQCFSLVPYIDLNNLQLFVVDYKTEPILMIIIPTNISQEQSTLVIGIKNTRDNNVLFNYAFEDKLA